jgi:hypothetical protein
VEKWKKWKKWKKYLATTKRDDVIRQEETKDRLIFVLFVLRGSSWSSAPG